MSGLDSIALAVARLEAMSKLDGVDSVASVDPIVDPIRPTKIEESVPESTSSASTTTIIPSSETTTMVSTSTTPMPQPFRTARVVSSDSISSSCYSKPAVHDNETSTASKSAASTTVPALTPSSSTSSASTSSSSSTSLSTDESQGLLRNHMPSILADPSAWLFTTEHKKPAPPPTGHFHTCHPEDVLCGRGGETNHHPGNIQYRNLVKAFQPLYIASKRRDKPRIAQCIVYTIRASGGRFLKRTDPRASTWADVGNTKAREKTSQALREGAPELRGHEHTKTGVVVSTTNTPALAVAPRTSTGSGCSATTTATTTATLLAAAPPSFYHAHHAHHPAAALALHHHHHVPPSAFLTATTTPAAASTTSMSTTIIPSNKRPSSSSTTNMTTTTMRGPRLKRLKQRVQEEDGGCPVTS